MKPSSAMALVSRIPGLSFSICSAFDLIQFVKMWLMRRIVALKSRKGDLHQKRHWVCDHIQKQW